MNTDDDLIAYLTGDDDGSLPADERASPDELRALLAARAVWEEPPPALENSILAAIADETRTHAPASRAAPALRRRSGWPRPALALAGLPAAALAAIAIVLGGRGAGQAPQRLAMIVSGTPLAARAHGSATLTKTASGWRVQLNVSGLTHLSNGRYYEAWLNNQAGIQVPIGTFNDARQVTLWAGAPATQFPTLTVTIQHASANPASSGRRVLVGTIRH